MSDVSVVIPSYNSALTIARTVDSLLNQTDGPPAEIIVVDSSDDGKTPRLLQEIRKGAMTRAPAIHVIHLAQQTMPAIGRNLGAKQARGPLLAFIDSDAYAASDWIARIREAFAQGLRVGGGSVRLPPEQRWHTIALAQYFLQFSDFLETGARRVKPFVPSVNLFCDKQLFDELGGFPEVRASEDVLFCLEAGKSVPVWFDPDVRVYHVFREDFSAYLRNQRMLGKYTLIYLRQTGATLYRGALPAFLLPAFILLKLARIVLRVVRTFDALSMAGFVYSLPRFVPGVTSWSGGFFKAALSGERE